jgi:hypothetical protein
MALLRHTEVSGWFLFIVDFFNEEPIRAQIWDCKSDRFETECKSIC